MSVFTPAEVAYLGTQRLGRIATVSASGQPHVVPVGFRYNALEDTIDIGGHGFAKSKKFRDAESNPRVGFVVDDLASVSPWRPRGIEVRGRAEVLASGGEAFGRGYEPADLSRSSAAHRELGSRGRAPERHGPAIGKLYLVATPIGNLEDVSLRALRVLQEVHMVACEDTRHTQILLRKHEIRAKHLTSYTEFNHRRKAAELVGQMDRGWDVALVTDAGTPGLSDPGEQLVVAAIAAGHEVVPIPGPAAAIAALVASGLPTREFTFVGFPEKKSGARRRELTELLETGRTLVLYESPFRVGDLLTDLAAVAPDARVAVAREMTKLHEEIVRGSASELAAHYASERPKGEITVVVAPAKNAGEQLREEREPGSER